MTARDGHWWARLTIMMGCLAIGASWCLEVLR